MFTSRLLPIVASVLALASCGVVQQNAPKPQTPRPAVAHRKLLVFFDGTNNEWDSRTNVRRLFEMVAAQEDPSILCYYNEGVGTTGSQIVGAGLGHGMKKRIGYGYNFLAQNYQQGDEIYIFGFSRGSLQARALAGIIAHAGLPDAHEKCNGKERGIPFDDVWDFCRGSNEHFRAVEIREGAGADRIRRENIKAFRARHGEFAFNEPSIRFLGVWDTVPGLSITHFLDDLGTQRHNGDKNDRYHIKAYPCIQEVAHAMSINERRSKFQVQRFGYALDPKRTRLHEVWFPGAHSDIGGGYADSNDMAGITLQWMLDYLKPCRVIPNGAGRVYGSALGIRHHPEATLMNRITSDPSPRVIPKGSVIHPAFLARARAGAVPERENDDKTTLENKVYRPDIMMQNEGPATSHKSGTCGEKAPVWKNAPGSPGGKVLDEAVFRKLFRVFDGTQ